MKHETARAALDHCETAMLALERLLHVVEEQASREDHPRCRTAVAHVRMAMGEIRRPMYLEHPELDAHGLALRPEALGRSAPARAPSTPAEKLEHVRTLALGYEDYADRKHPPNKDIFGLCFREFLNVAVLAEAAELPEGAAPRSTQILDAVIRLAGFMFLLSARGNAPAEPTEH